MFVTDSSGNLRDFKIDMDADYTPEDASYKGITFLDRDISGVIVSCHNSTGVGALVWATVKHSEGGCQNATGGMSAHPQYADILMNQSNTAPKAMLGSGAILWSPGRDGYTDGATTFQGARAYDPQLGSWTTPDAFQGGAEDPTSQQAYAWNGNNALIFSDPTGYCKAGAGETPDASDPTCTISVQKTCPNKGLPPCGDWTPESQSSVVGAARTIGAENVLLTMVVTGFSGAAAYGAVGAGAATLSAAAPPAASVPLSSVNTFYTGGAQAAANKFAEDNGLATINSTAEAASLQASQLGAVPGPSTLAPWITLSQAAASTTTSPEVFAVIGNGYSEANIFGSVELPALLNNANVESIIFVNMAK